MNDMQLLRAQQGQSKRPKHFWEKDNKLKIQTFAEHSASVTFKLGRAEHLLAALKEKAPPAGPVVEQVRLPVLPYAARRAKLLDWPAEADDMRRRALRLIRVMVESDFNASNDL